MFIRSTGIALPDEKVTLGPDFLRSKQHYEDEKEVSFYRASDEDSPLSLACRAAEDALSKAAMNAGDLDAVIYNKSLLKDYEQWSLSSAICNRLKISGTMFLDISQTCNGLAGVELARDLLASRPGFENIMVVTSQILPPRLGSHEQIERGGILSDGGSAWIISRGGGQYEIMSLIGGYNSRICDFIKLPYGGTEALKKSDRVEEWSAAASKDAFWDGREPSYEEDFFGPIRNNIRRSLEMAGIEARDVSFLIFPNYCRLYTSYIVEMFPNIPFEKTSTGVGMSFSHMGASDVQVNLSALHLDIGRGDLVMVHQNGTGLSFASMLLKPVSSKK